MISWFRRTRPTPPAPVDSGERVVAAYWGYTPDDWRKLTDFQRAYCRANVTQADRFVS